MAGMSKSEYARHKAQQDVGFGFVFKVLWVAFLVIAIPSLVIPFIGLVFTIGLIWNVLADGLVKEDRY